VKRLLKNDSADPLGMMQAESSKHSTPLGLPDTRLMQSVLSGMLIGVQKIPAQQHWWRGKSGENNC